jgi:PilZ domain-containing protein
MSISNIADMDAPVGRLRGERQGDRPKIVPDRRRFKRVPVTLNGRFMTEDKQEYPCEVFNMSPGGMALRAPMAPRPGERVVAYLENLGRLEGIVARLFDGGFAVEIKASAQKRERIANLLTWYTNRDLGGEERQHERFEPRIAAQKLIMPNSDVYDCRVIDVSLSGASVATGVKPPLETVVVLGRLRGRVVRHHDQGFAIQFAELQDPDSLARTFG